MFESNRCVPKRARSKFPFATSNPPVRQCVPERFFPDPTTASPSSIIRLKTPHKKRNPKTTQRDVPKRRRLEPKKCRSKFSLRPKKCRSKFSLRSKKCRSKFSLRFTLRRSEFSLRPILCWSEFKEWGGSVCRCGVAASFTEWVLAPVPVLPTGREGARGEREGNGVEHNGKGIPRNTANSSTSNSSGCRRSCKVLAWNQHYNWECIVANKP